MGKKKNAAPSFDMIVAIEDDGDFVDALREKLGTFRGKPDITQQKPIKDRINGLQGRLYEDAMRILGN